MVVTGAMAWERWLDPPDGHTARSLMSARSLMAHIFATDPSETQTGASLGSPGSKDDPDALSIFSEAPTAVLEPNVPRDWPAACDHCLSDVDTEACCKAAMSAERENPDWFGVFCSILPLSSKGASIL